ncbi:3-oxoacyl-ACP synthase III family protein [Roseivirga misakiensis]|uniref:3-oxoacyl-ACP synthase n=1 Tax=Roseivirga misakiensis TaxID=1563681 RepID=A0A1E5T3M7_9BACT|nr:ketoacyl-ACP synthase III [Roseivirga misakiensis]OEK05941.1 3-oxoacyl-ACP synthase [Roseivirga misakiensis]
MSSVVINGVGSCIPERVVPNSEFLNAEFYQENGEPFPDENEVIIRKFEKITGIKERRYALPGQKASDLGAIAAKHALENSSIDGNDLDYIIFAHNFGDMRKDNNRIDMMPSLAARVKGQLEISNPSTSCYDIIFGCPGWVQGAIQATQMIRCGDAKHVMVIGGETLSQTVDPHDRDSMIFADGAGATIFSASESEKGGYISQCSRTDASEELCYLAMGPSYNASLNDHGGSYIKMKGRKIYEYALTNVADAIKCAIEKANLDLKDISKILIHQANEKMDEAILHKLFKLYGVMGDSKQLMPMTIQRLGNSSVATIPTMLDLILRGELDDHALASGDHVIFASVGAGMHINAMVYQMP